MRRLFSTRKRTAAVLTTILALILAGVGISAWLTTATNPPTKTKIGSLSGGVTFGAIGLVTNPATGTCLPGGTCDANVAVVNNTGVPLKLISWSANPLTATAVSGGTTGCTTPGDVGSMLSSPGAVGQNITIPAGTTQIVLPGYIAVSTNLPSGCQSAVVSLSASGQIVEFSTN